MAAVTKPRVDRTRPDALVRLALEGKVRIPRFQRPFRWEKSDVVQLFDSIYRGYPIGNLLMWQRPAQRTSIELGPLRIKAPEIRSLAARSRASFTVPAGRLLIPELGHDLTVAGIAVR